MNRPLMVAFDVSNQQTALKLAQALGPDGRGKTVKVGMELYYKEGAQILQKLQELGYAIFLDLKLYDIPHTVEKAMLQLARLGVDYVTVHAMGGREMLQAAKRGLVQGAAESGLPAPKLLAITELTSASEEIVTREQNCRLSLKEQVLSLAKLAKDSGCDGVVCSALEVEALRRAVGDDFFYLVPGIRMADDQVGDQVRVATPAMASKAGASAIVVGRPINQSPQPKRAYERYLADWQEGTKEE
ncbi:orotidine-5'-phosphate decarboxylase [Fructobacillus sp. M1-13]|uniref:Orotidine 5'-phosphate decarboxylase n=1 Tax=Fructobacillus papyriferae TaxID=2713171 RepID=A0ABS5QRC8_9LACO|nr:orotidine-5'-phosphate decarboxylase [Fructobacillus papyriferae]MBS9335060.1 orotidine-5'-phosphate decarboxylase [Fructobacillus papyriferae]MCD2159454.1 orotidine-5'-phosphate decarboxylase [Fructobacillus papyriferae]